MSLSLSLFNSCLVFWFFFVAMLHLQYHRFYAPSKRFIMLTKLQNYSFLFFFMCLLFLNDARELAFQFFKIPQTWILKCVYAWCMKKKNLKKLICCNRQHLGSKFCCCRCRRMLIISNRKWIVVVIWQYFCHMQIQLVQT